MHFDTFRHFGMFKIPGTCFFFKQQNLPPQRPQEFCLIPAGFRPDSGRIPAGFRLDSGRIPAGFRPDPGRIPAGSRPDPGRNPVLFFGGY